MRNQKWSHKRYPVGRLVFHRLGIKKAALGQPLYLYTIDKVKSDLGKHGLEYMGSA